MANHCADARLANERIFICPMATLGEFSHQMMPHPFDSKIGRALAPLMFRRSRTDSSGFPAQTGLTADELNFFRLNGYLVKHQVVSEKVAARAREYTWENLPAGFDRASAETWRGMVTDSLCERTVADRKGRVKFRECVRGEKWLYEMIDGNRCIRSTVEALLGVDQVPGLPYIRGLYPVLPCTCSRLKVPRPHTDGHRFFVGTLTYLSDVTPGGGGFHIWPGSHLLMRNCFKSVAGSGWTADYHRELYCLAKRTPAVEIVAPAGGVIFWHHRLAHAAGINRSNSIRHAVLADYPPANYAAICDRGVGLHPWEFWGERLNS